MTKLTRADLPDIQQLVNWILYLKRNLGVNNACTGSLGELLSIVRLFEADKTGLIESIDYRGGHKKGEDFVVEKTSGGTVPVQVKAASDGKKCSIVSIRLDEKATKALKLAISMVSGGKGRIRPSAKKTVRNIIGKGFNKEYNNNALIWICVNMKDPNNVEFYLYKNEEVLQLILKENLHYLSLKHTKGFKSGLFANGRLFRSMPEFKFMEDVDKKFNAKNNWKKILS